jgi:hypothetical protein
VRAIRGGGRPREREPITTGHVSVRRLLLPERRRHMPTPEY